MEDRIKLEKKERTANLLKEIDRYMASDAFAQGAPMTKAITRPGLPNGASAGYIAKRIQAIWRAADADAWEADITPPAHPSITADKEANTLTFRPSRRHRGLTWEDVPTAVSQDQA